MDYFFSFEKMAYVKGDKPSGCNLCLIRDNSPLIIDLTVYRNDFFIVCVNLYPYNPGHLLIFPVRHLEDIREFTKQEEKNLALLKRSFLDISDLLFNPSGYNIGYNMGLPSGASIAHIHMHIIPRYPNEAGIADLIAGRRVLVESPLDSAEKIKEHIRAYPDSILIS